MFLNPGTRLGPYEIVGPLGAGGMGQVYRARDTRLGREVALKVLPHDVAGDPARRFRFEQEARAAAALNHPNVTGLHDVGEEGGVSFIVTELVPGETLEAILARGPVPLKRLLDIAVQIADGMASAHAARIAHRDLKPANLMVTGEGRVKILDFGLAKQASDPTSIPDNTATVAIHQTEPGMIIGTVLYMSPEQARGKPADYRSDQFSFGLILYEMASGKKAFDRPESVQILSAILSEDHPPIDRSIPAPLRWAIDRCLAKDAADRYESSRDLFHELRHLRDNLAEFSSVGQRAVQRNAATTPAPRAAVPRRKIPWRVPAAFVAGAAAAGALAFILAGPSFPDQSVYRYTPFSFEPGGQYAAVWAPNGKAVAYAARPKAGSPAQIFVRYIDSATPVQITRLGESAEPIAWAPDSARIFFRSDREPAGVWSVAAVGGEPEPVMAIGPGGPLHVSPDAKSVATLRRGDDPTFGVSISSPPGTPWQRYKPDPFATSIVYNVPRLKFSPDGKSILLFLHGEKHREEAWLLPYPADPKNPPKRVLDNMQSFGGTPNFAWMPDSRHVLLVLMRTPDSSLQIWKANVVSGKAMALTSGTANFNSVAVSPEGTRLILSEGTGNYDIVSLNLENAAVTGLIATGLNELMPAWAANQSMVYITDRNGAPEIWLRTQDGASRPLVTARDFPPGTTQWFMAPALSNDGARVIYSRLEPNGGGGRLWISAVSGGAPVPLTNEANATEFPGSFSPDGTWFAYQSIHNGKKDLMKVKVSGQAAPVLVKSNVQGEVPVWSPANEWILVGDDLVSPDGQTVKPLGERFTVNYAFSPDGKLLYGLRAAGDNLILFSLEIATGKEKIIGNAGRDFAPASNLHPGIRFSVAPDGRSIAFGTGQFRNNLWILEGFAK